MRLALLLLLTLACTGIANGASSVLINTVTWDEVYPNWTRTDSLFSAKGMSSSFVVYGPSLNNNPAIKVRNFSNSVLGDPVFLGIGAHGVDWGNQYWCMVEFYSDWSEAWLQWEGLYEELPAGTIELFDLPRQGDQSLIGFAVSGTGIFNLLVPLGLPEGAIIYGGYCWSDEHFGAWRWKPATDSYTGYTCSESLRAMGRNLWDLAFRITCNPVTSASGLSYRFPIVKNAVNGGGDPTLSLAGCIHNRDIVDVTLTRSKSGCANPDVALDLLGIDEDRRVYLGIAPRSSDARYLLRRGAMVDTMVCTSVAKYDRFGRDVLEATLPAIVDTFEIVESAYGSIVASTGTWATAVVPPCAPDSLYDAVDLFPDPLSTAQAAAIDDSLSYLLESEEGYNAVVAARWESFAAPVVADLEEQGKSVFKIVNPFLSPEMVTYYYRRVVEQNERVGGDWPAAPGPTLYLSGSAMLVRYAVAPGDASECGGACYSDLAMTDIDGDWLPNGPVTRIPGYTPEEIEAVLQAAAEYRAGTSVNPQRRVAFWCDDEDYQWVLNMRSVAELYDGIGYSDGAVVKLSQVPGSSTARFARFCDIVNGGIAELWSFGYSSDHMWGSAFKLAPYGSIRAEDFDQLTTEQVFIAWAPTCHTAFTSELMGSQSIAGALMLPGAGSASRLAGFVGRVSAGGDIAQWLIAEALAAARCEAAPGIDSVADVVYRGVLDFVAEYPMFRDIALGTSVLGGNVVLQGVDPSAAAVLAGAPGTALSLSSIASGSSTEFQYSRSGSGMAYGMLTVYDVRGRLVRRIDAGELAATGSIVWDGRDVSGRTIASGVYLGLLEVRGAAGTLRGVSKATVVR